MRALQRIGAVGLFAMVALVASHCSTGAVGVDVCRDIEAQRCELIAGCPLHPIQTPQDVANCKLFYRDQCEYGLADGANPDGAAVASCKAALDASAACRAEPLSSCVGAPELHPDANPDQTGCDALALPQDLVACAFLRPAPAETTETTADTGGSGGNGGGGAGGDAAGGGS